MEPVVRSLWIYRGLYLVFAMTLIFLRLLPLRHEAGALPGPDLVLVMTLAWVMRRQDYVPVWLVIIVFLTEDVMLMRPPGLWSALVVLACEFVRMRRALVRDLNFAAEWALVSGLVLAIVLIYRFVLAITFVPQVSFGFALVQVLWSIVAFPGVVMLTRFVLAFHKPTLGEIATYGRKF